MRDLDDPQARRRNRRPHLASTALPDVARQQHETVAPPQVEHDRIVVADLLPLPVGGPGWRATTSTPSTDEAVAA